MNRRGPGSGSPPGDPLLDLPLGGEDGESETPPRPEGGGPPPRRSAAPPSAGPSPTAGAARARPRGRRIALVVGVVVALAAAGVAGYLVPRSSPAVARPSAALLDFGETRVDRGGEPRELSVENGGERRLTVAAVRIAGDAAGDFEMTDDRCTGARLAAGQSCTVALRFLPRGAGTRRAELRVEGDAANTPLGVPLAGVGTAPALAIEPSALDFGEQPVGGTAAASEVILANPGSAPLRLKAVAVEGPAAGEFSITANRCSGEELAPGGRCRVRVAFAPGEAGRRSAALRVWSDAEGGAAGVALAGVGVAARLAAEPSAVDFGGRPVGAAAAVRRLRLTNPGDAAVRVEGVELGGEGGGFAVGADGCRGRTLAPGAACEVELRWAPAAEGAVAATLVVRAAGEESGLEVPLTGAGVVSRLAVEPAAVDFGRGRVGRAGGEATVRVVNRGEAAVGMAAAAVVGGDAEAFAVRTDGCRGRQLGPGDGCEVSLGFRPGRTGTLRAALEVRPALDGGGAPPRATLAGVGTAPELAVRGEGPVSFGGVELGDSAERRVELANPGSAPLALSSVEVAGAAAADYAVDRSGCAREVPAGGGCALGVTFTPRAAGSRQAELRVSGGGEGAGGAAVRVPLDGFGTPRPTPEIRVSRTAVPFGDVAVGGRSGIEDLGIENRGSGRLLLQDIAITGPAAGDFRIVPGSCAGALVPGSDCSFGIRFSPTAPGERRARLVVRHNAEGGQAAVALTGRGLESP